MLKTWLYSSLWGGTIVGGKLECRDPGGCTSEEKLLEVMLSTSLHECRPGVISASITAAPGLGTTLNPHGSAFDLQGQGAGAAAPRRCSGAGGPAAHPRDVSLVPHHAWHLVHQLRVFPEVLAVRSCPLCPDSPLENLLGPL